MSSAASIDTTDTKYLPAAGQLIPNETYELADGITWTVEGDYIQFGLLNNNTISGSGASLVIKNTGIYVPGNVNAAIGEYGANINVNDLKLSSDVAAIYQSNNPGNRISIKAKTIDIKAGTGYGIYAQGNAGVSISGFDSLTVASEKDAALKVSESCPVSIIGNKNSTANLTSNGVSAVNTHLNSSVNIQVGSLTISSTVDDADKEYKKSTVYSNGGSINLTANVLTVNANGSAVENAIASAANGAIQITSGNATVNGNINTLGDFDLNGTLNFHGEQANIANLTGNSTINLFNENQELTVNNNEILTVAGSGDLNDSYAGDLNGFLEQVTVTNVADGKTTLLLKEGLYNGETSAKVGENGRLTDIKSSRASSVMHDTLDIASGSTVMLNRILMNDVHKRMGDLRNSAGMNGAWVRYDGGRLSGDHVANKFNTIQLGADMPFADNFHAGVSASYTRGDVDFTRGGSGMDAYSLAAYGTWFAPNGMYADVIARYGYVKNELTVDNNLKGDLDNNAVALSGEFGWKFDVADNFFVTPQVEATYMHIDSDKVKLGGNTASYKFDSVDSFVGRAGLAAGYTFPNQKGNVFVKASAVHEFAGDSKVTAGNGTSLKKDGEDTWAEFGVGAQYNFNKNVQAWANLERTAGADIEEDYRATVGARINF